MEAQKSRLDPPHTGVSKDFPNVDSKGLDLLRQETSGGRDHQARTKMHPLASQPQDEHEGNRGPNSGEGEG